MTVTPFVLTSDCPRPASQHLGDSSLRSELQVGVFATEDVLAVDPSPEEALDTVPDASCHEGSSGTQTQQDDSSQEFQSYCEFRLRVRSAHLSKMRSLVDVVSQASQGPF